MCGTDLRRSPLLILYPYKLCSKYKILKVLLDGLHDPESSLNKLREPNDVRRPVMDMIWDQITEDWQVDNSLIFQYLAIIVISFRSDMIYYQMFDDGGSSYLASCSFM